MTPSTDKDPDNLGRFLEAQEGIYETALEELRSGHKRTHWMWFIFPQVAGLGQSPISIQYAIADREEARAYLDHPVLGQRLRQCAQAVLDLQDRTIPQVFTFPDDLKFHSSMTLFEEVDEPGGVFRKILDKYFNGSLDLATIKHLK